MKSILSSRASLPLPPAVVPPRSGRSLPAATSPLATSGAAPRRVIGLTPCALLLLWLGCAGGKEALRPGGPDEPLITEEEGLRDPPARGAPDLSSGSEGADGPRADRATSLSSRRLRGDAAQSPADGPTPVADLAPSSPAEEPPPAGEPAPGKAAQGAKPVAYAGPKGTIRRPDLLALLDGRPAAFLRRVDSEPRFEQGRFRGWRINAFFRGDNRFSDIDLLSGDVVTRVNGKTIEQPDQFMRVWEEMRVAKELRVDLLRNGQPHVARWSIVD